VIPDAMTGCAHEDGMRPKRAARPLACLLLVSSLPGCASLSERECRGEDWYKVGFDDGYDGSPATEVAEHREACAPYGITPDVEQYEVGRRDGLVHYCTVTRGFEIGRQGLSYSGGCPAGRDREFLRGHHLGRRFHDVDEELARVESDLRSYRYQLDTPDLDEGQQRGVYSRIRDLEFERSRLETERRHLEWELRRL
jgi:hypothetical protein